VISSNGTLLEGNAYRINYSAGESIVGLMSNSNSQVSNGYHKGLDLSLLSSEDNNILDIGIFPNPISYNLNIKNDKNYDLNFELYNLNGQLLISELIINNKINLSSITQGIYILKVINTENDLSESFKIIKK